MRTADSSRRSFLRGAGTSLLGAGAVAGIGLPASPAVAVEHYVSQNADTQAAMTPERALEKLRDGNARFVAGNSLARDFQQQIRATKAGQFPFAAVVGCIDSRVSNELIFDQGIGDFFCTRVAGNFVNDDMLGSLEFACALSGAKLIVVVGHTGCGAIRGACDDVVYGNLTQTLANIKPAVAAVSGFEEDRSSANAAFVQAVADKNVVLTKEKIRERSPILRGLIEKGAVGLAGAMYDINSGRVSFI